MAEGRRYQTSGPASSQPEDLGKARPQVKVTVPTELARFEFTAGSPQTAQKSGRIQAVVEKIDQDIAQVGAQNGRGLWIFGFDQTGQAISAKESMGSEGSQFARFSGIIHKLVVLAAKILDHTFNVDVDLNQGRRIELTHKPQVPPRIRLDLSPTKKMPDLDRRRTRRPASDLV